jgi:hypothetical protein
MSPDAVGGRLEAVHKLDRQEGTPHQRVLRLAPVGYVQLAAGPQAEKKEIYERNGVDEYWIVDPRGKAVTIFHLGERGYGDGQTFRSGILRSRALPKLHLSLGKLFAV